MRAGRQSGKEKNTKDSVIKNAKTDYNEKKGLRGGLF